MNRPFAFGAWIALFPPAIAGCASSDDSPGKGADAAATGGANDGGNAGTGGRDSRGGGTGGSSSGNGGSVEPADVGNAGGAIAPVHDAAPPSEVATCKSLPASSAGWHDITPSQARGLEALSVVVDPYDQSLYAAADTSSTPGTGVLRSTDCGATFELVSTGKNADVMKSGGLWAMMIAPSPAQAPTIYAANGYGNGPTIYRSTNGGVDFTALDPDPDDKTGQGLPFVHTIGMDPSEPAHIAVGFHGNCEAPRAKVCFSESLDGGDSWQMFDGPPELGGWEEGASLTVLGRGRYLYIGNRGSYTTDDRGAHWKHLTGSAVYCCYGGITLRLPDGSLLAPIGDNSAGLWLSQAGSGPLGANLAPLAGTPDQIISLITDGERVFAGRGYFDLTQPYWSAPLNDLGHWTQMKTPTISRAPNQMAYDPVHHVIYSANWGAGFWRYVTKDG